MKLRVWNLFLWIDFNLINIGNKVNSIGSSYIFIGNESFCLFKII